MSVNKNSTHHTFGIAALLVCAIIWGTSFVAQSLGSQEVEPLTFNAVRNTVATIFLIIIAPLLDKLLGKPYHFWGTTDPRLKRKLWRGSIIAGLCLASAMFMQQWGITYTTAGKSGFITALYIILVPLFGLLFFQHPITKYNWLGVVIATIGMYFICINEVFSITKGDFITLACPVLFSLQILAIDYYIPDLDGVRFSTVQFGISAIVSGVLALIFEHATLAQISSSILPILYLAIMSSGIAYTLQIIGQKYVDTVIASLLMSLESVFALISGWLYLNQAMTIREITGCVIVFIAIILAQLPDKHNK